MYVLIMFTFWRHVLYFISSKFILKYIYYLMLHFAFISFFAK